MILHRSARGVLSVDDQYVRLRARPDTNVIERFPLEDFRAGALDAKIMAALGPTALAEATAREVLARSGETLEPSRAEARHAQRSWGNPRDDYALAEVGDGYVKVWGGVSFTATFDEILEKGFPPEIAAEIRGWPDEVIESVKTLKAVTCACGTGFTSPTDEMSNIVWWKEADGKSACVWRCTMCNRGWTFERLGFRSDAHQLSQSADFTPDELDRILTAIRGGETAQIGSGRSSTSYRAGEGGGFVREDYEDGQGEERPVDENDVRWAITNDPDAFIDVLRKPIRAKLRDALLDTPTQEARTKAKDCLADLEHWGPCLEAAPLLEAILDWPERKPSPEEMAALVKGRDGRSLYHVVMSAVGYGETSRACGQLGDRVFTTVDAMLGGVELPGFHRYRAGFRLMAGDPASAVADLEWAKSHLGHGDDAEGIARELETARAQLASPPGDDVAADVS